MAREELLSLIRRIRAELPRVRYVVLSGGEVTLLGRDLLDAISTATALGLGSRIVTNGHWARTDAAAERWVSDLSAAGLGELNLSTGDEHREWVPVERVARAALHAIRKQILTVVTVEAGRDARRSVEEFLSLPQVGEILADQGLADRLITVTSVWMPFHAGAGRRYDGDVTAPSGCDNIFTNLGVNPHGALISCCGLTVEHIPEMKVGRVNDPGTLQQAYAAQFDDLLKLWIWVDGTRAILDLAAARSGRRPRAGSSHHCAMCVELYREPWLRSAARELVARKADDLVFRSLLKASLTGRTERAGTMTAENRHRA